jgi:hypothetical protein
MPEEATITREEFEELADSVRRLARQVSRNGGNGGSAAAADFAPLIDAVEELTDQVKRLRREGLITEEDAARLADCFERRFIVAEEESESEPEPKTKSKGEEVEDKPPKGRRSYFPDA